MSEPTKTALSEPTKTVPRKSEILGLWHEPEAQRSRWLIWAGVLGLVAAGGYVALREPADESVLTNPIAEWPVDTTIPDTTTGAKGGTSTVATSAALPGGAARLDLVPREARIAPGATVGMKAIATGGSGKPLTGRDVEWRTDAPAVAAVSRTGVVTGVAPGGAIVTATSGGRSASAVVTVMWRGATSLQIQPANVSVAVNRTARLSAVARDANGNVVALRGVEWSSSAPRTAAVSPDGVVTGLAPGTARISATGDGVSGEPATVTVQQGPAPVAAAPVPVKRVAPVAAPFVAPRAPVRSAGPVAPGVVQMLVTPWALVSIDGHAAQHRARWVDTLSARVPHRMHFERPGFVTFDTIVTLQPGEQRVLEIQMTPRKP